MKLIIALSVGVVGTLIFAYVFFLPDNLPSPHVYVIVFIVIFAIVYCLTTWVSKRKGKKKMTVTRGQQ
jgi:membrane protein insertase Oxa1/YidC/SpoIIIJ